MDGGLAIVSLSLQLSKTAQEISALLTSIRKAPKELAGLIESLDGLRNILQQIHVSLDRQKENLQMIKSSECISGALNTCERKLKPLQELSDKYATSLGCQNRSLQTLTSFKLVMKEDTIGKYVDQLREAKLDLHLAITSTIWESQ